VKRCTSNRKAAAVVICLFSAWDFHLPPGGYSQLIEFNDNGSGFLFPAIINAPYYDTARLGESKLIAAPARLSAFTEFIGKVVEQRSQNLLPGPSNRPVSHPRRQCITA
jgi:hypothetical protein